MIEDPWVKELLEEAHHHGRDDRLARFDAHLPCLLFELDQLPDGCLRFVFLSGACADVLGVSRGVLYADAGQLLCRITEEDRPALLEALERSATQSKPVNWEGRLRIDAWNDLKWINLRATPAPRDECGVRWTGMITNISQSKRLQEEICQSRRQLSALAAHVEEVKEQERRRIERDLHDDLGGNLTALKMMLHHVWKSLPPDPYLDDRYAYFETLLNTSIASIHRISADLRPGILDAGLVAALEWLSSEFELQTGIACEFRCKDLDISLDPTLATTLFRIAQEACNNIRKHAQASGVEIQLHDDGSESPMRLGTSFSMRPSSCKICRVYGCRVALAIANIGRFCSSTICIRKPSLVMSINSCFLNWRSVGLASIACSIFFFSDSSACRSRRSSSVSADFRSSTLRTSPSLRVTSLPPPLMTLLRSDAEEPPLIATFSGVLKYSAMPSSVALDVELSSHISRKKAIIAVTKSA